MNPLVSVVVVSYNTKSIVTSNKTASRGERPRGTDRSERFLAERQHAASRGAANRDRANQGADASVVRHRPAILTPQRGPSTPAAKQAPGLGHVHS